LDSSIFGCVRVPCRPWEREKFVTSRILLPSTFVGEFKEKSLHEVMSLTYWLVIAALDLAGVIFSARMLRRCFQDKMKNTFLYKYRTLAICQCACQATFVVTDAVQSWKGFEIQARESCDVFRVLSISTLFFQACNITAMMIVYSDHGSPAKNNNNNNNNTGYSRSNCSQESIRLIRSSLHDPGLLFTPD